jgi:hypothetical protein
MTSKKLKMEIPRHNENDPPRFAVGKVSSSMVKHEKV